MELTGESHGRARHGKLQRGAGLVDGGRRTERPVYACVPQSRLGQLASRPWEGREGAGGQGLVCVCVCVCVYRWGNCGVKCERAGCGRARWATMGLKEVWLWASSGSKIHGGFTVGRDVDLWTCGVGTDGRPSVSPVHSKTTWNTAKGTGSLLG